MMHNLNHWTLFLNPSLQSIDEAARAFVRDPIKYTTKAFFGVTVPSIYLWFAFKDDDEIQELRQTESGRRFWWVRDAEGDIRKIPKPILDGQMWGSSVESWLDKEQLGNPTAVDTWRNALLQDAWLHLIPTFISVPTSVATNYNVQFGGNIVPESAQDLDPQLQANRGTSDAMRIVGRGLAKYSGPMSRSDNGAIEGLARAMSPAGLDFVVRNIGGEIPFELVKAAGQAWLYLTEPGFSVEAEDRAFFSSLTPRFPTTGAASIREFYTHARRFEKIYNTGMRLLRSDPEEGVQYVDDHFASFALAEATREGRADLADMRAAIFDLEENTDFTRKEKKEITDELIRMMILTAKTINLSIRDITKELK